MSEQYKMLDANDPIVQGIINQSGIKPGKNGNAPVAPNSRVRLPKVEPEAPKAKRVSVSLTPEQQATLIRESAIRGIELKEHLQNLVNELLSERIGKATIKGASFMSNPQGVKITGPSKSFGKDNDAN